MSGRFRTAPGDLRDVSFTWSGDTAGQGWGIDESRGGMKAYATMLNHQPDFFIHCGDTIYADGPLKAEVDLPDGTKWKNLLIEEKAKVAETLAEYRGQYKYNLLDKNVVAFNAQVPMLAQWDDHEVTNNWSDSKSVRRCATPKRTCACWRRARRGRSTNSCRSRRSPRSRTGSIARSPTARCSTCSSSTCGAIAAPTATIWNRRPARTRVFLGRDQIEWLKRELLASQGDLEGDLRRHAAVAAGLQRLAEQEGLRRHRQQRARRRQGPRDGIRRAAVLHEGGRHPQHRLADRRRALHRRALLRSGQGGVPGLQPVLGIRLGPDPCRHVRPQRLRT